MGLVATEAAVRPDQLLEGRDLAGLLVPDRVDHQVRAVRVGVGPRHLQPGGVAEGRQRIRADHRPGRKLELPVGTEHQRAAGLGRDEQEADAGMLDQRADQVGVQVVDELARQASRVMGEVDEAEVAGREDDDLLFASPPCTPSPPSPCASASTSASGPSRTSPSAPRRRRRVARPAARALRPGPAAISVRAPPAYPQDSSPAAVGFCSPVSVAGRRHAVPTSSARVQP